MLLPSTVSEIDAFGTGPPVSFLMSIPLMTKPSPGFRLEGAEIVSEVFTSGAKIVMFLDAELGRSVAIT